MSLQIFTNSSPYFVVQGHLKEKPDYCARSQSLKLNPRETVAMNKPTKDVSQRLLGLLSMDEPELRILSHLATHSYPMHPLGLNDLSTLFVNR